MHSASYNVFTNSRLWGRLTDAEQEFAGAAGSDFGSPFLKSIAGTQSIFAWYDIGNLEMLYITRLKPGQSDSITLLASRSRFTARKVGDTTFYVRAGSAAGADSGSTGQQRTVAFAQRGEWFLFATREDLLANALLLMQGVAKAPSLAEEGWYDAAAKAAPAQHGDLRMLLNLDRITHTPQFESYWIQNNITDTRRYRAAEVDLYREAGQLREERVLLPAAGAVAPAESEDTSALSELVPQDAGVYRATANPSAGQAIAELRDKVLERAATPQLRDEYAPDADLSVPEAGDGTDLETRIDAQQPVVPRPDAWLAPLENALKDVPLTAMLSVSRASAQSKSLFLPVDSAVVLRRTGAWDEAAFSRAVLEGVRSRLTVSGVGVEWPKREAAGVSLRVATGANPIVLAIVGDTVVIGTDESMVRGIVARLPKTPVRHAAAATIAEFRQPQVRPAFMQLSATLDRAASESSRFAAGAAANESAERDATASQPAFFHDTMGSLSHSFESLGAERFLERHDGDKIHQTVLYLWATPTSSASPH